MYAKIVDGALAKYPYSLAEMRAENPKVEISDAPSDATLALCSAKRATLGPAPIKSSRTHTFERTFFDNTDGSVQIVYEAHELSRGLAEFNMRDARNSALTRCDWVITRAFEDGTPVPAAYLAYRQALRDLPSQPGFPYDYVWPQEPGSSQA
jgi:hypothetical protein